MRGVRAFQIGFAVCVALAFGCEAPTDPSMERLPLAVEGPWVIPPETLAVGDTQYVDYTGAGPWVGESGCGGSFLPGTQLLEDWLYANWPQISNIGGYSCRPINGNPDVMSVHATGRAIDVHIPTIGSEADNDLGDPVGNYLIEHAEEMGIQFIIWDRWKWRANATPGDKDGYYSGAHPHNDHLHVELSPEAASLELPWYQEPMDPPDVPPCGVVPAAGGIVDDMDVCAQAYGPAQYWRVVEGEGYGGRLLWTDAWETSAPSNWARYDLHMESAGTYEVEYHSTSAYAVFDAAIYEINHNGEKTALAVDQAGLDGWVSLGAFDFAKGGQQSVEVFDSSVTPVGDAQHIVFDAIRLTRLGDDGEPDPDPDPDPEPDPDPDDGDPGDDDPNMIGGGCSTGGNSAGTWALLPVALAFAARRRRARGLQ